ncbi:MAG: hypothetical protein JO200_08415 [Comamonas sp.]|nr:hypothetical protein [Comamonas sp.]
MAKNTRSIDRVCKMKGQRLLAFFLLLAGASTAIAHEFSVNMDHRSSSGLAYKEHWLDKGLNPDAKTVAASLNASAGAVAEVGGLELEVAAKYKGYYVGSENVLYLAALAETSNKFAIPHNGIYSLNGRLQMLQSRQVTLSKTLQFGDNLKLHLKPHVFSIEDYQSAKARGTLAVDGQNANVQGTLNRVGTRRFGFLVNEKEDQGWGWGLDVAGTYTQGPWRIDFSANNLLSQLRFSSVHYSNRLYNVNAVNGEIEIKRHNSFSMTGEYGHQKSNERLPVQTQIALSNSNWNQWQAGLYSVSDRVTPWLAYQYSHGPWYARATTMQFQNLSLDLSWLSANGSGIGVGVTFAGNGKPRLGQLMAKVVW